MDQRLRFVTRVKRSGILPESMNVVPEIKRAFKIANEVNLTPEQIEDMEMQEMFIHDQRNIVKKALNQGRAEGRQKGRKERVEEGKLAARLEMARQLLDVLDDEAISRTSELSVQEIVRLRSEKI